jgi:serine/threonine-protein kinase
VINRVFSNRYRLIEKIGIGGMAEVYKATDEVLGRTVAVKVMLPQYASDPTFAARFKQEAQSAANLQSPYIVNIYDWGHDSSDNTYYIVMEYVRGTDLKTAIQQRGAIQQRKVAEIGSQVCAALSVAHGYDIIHRDIKPHNIMVQPDGNAKVMDFGIARANGSTMTQTGSVLGTAYYVSPEQAQGKPLTPATDLYSLGVVLYEATTGRVPFDAPDAVAVALKQVNEQPTPPSEINPDIDPGLEAIILRALEKNPLNRYATAEQMRIALNNYLAGRPIDTDVAQSAAATRVMNAAGLPVINADGAQPPAHTAVMPSVDGGPAALNVRSASRAKEEEKRRRKKRTTIIAVVVSVLAVALIGIGVYYFLTSGAGKVEVPDVVGETAETAREMIEAAELRPGAEKLEASETVPLGVVISTDPSARTKVDKDSVVDLVVSSGPEKPKEVTVPNLSGMTLDQARDALTALNLGFENRGERFDDTIEAGKICAQEPAADTVLEEGKSVVFYVSKGKESKVVPFVVDSSEEAAVAAIEAAGLQVARTDPEYDDRAAGTVIRQSPTAASTANKGDTVTITVSLGPKPISVPDLTGLTREQATSKLQEVGLFIRFEDKVTEAAAQIDKVVAQDPAAGASATRESTVTVYIGIKPES